jgi:4-amino-4-deoxy-L-arabinose transferase-like glycosyltransferase
MKQSYSYLIVTLALALLARMWVFTHKVPDLNDKDGFAYLNAARVLRGENVPAVMDNIVKFPRNETLGRPVYPLFLNIAFALARWSPTPSSVLERVKERQPRLNDDWHWQFFTTKENLRAVQFLQHFLGLLATVIAFWLLWEWTKTGWLATLGSLFAVGWRPAWLFFERCILTETLAAFLLLTTVFFFVRAHRNRGSLIWMIAALVASYLLALTRPNFLFLPPLLLLYFAWRLPERFTQLHWLRKVVFVLIPIVVMVGCWKIYHAISAYHFALVPEALEDPILRQTLKEHLTRNPNDHHAIYNIRPTLMERWGTSWAETDARLAEETRKALSRRPDVFLKSTLGGLVEYFFYAGISWGSFRGLISLLLAIFNLLGLLALLLRNSPMTLKFGLGVVIFNALACSVVIGVNAEQARYAFPTEAILSLAAFWVVWHLMQSMRTKFSQTPTIIQ